MIIIQYAGLWYEIERFENVFQQGTSCERAIYEEICNYIRTNSFISWLNWILIYFLATGVVSVLNTAVLADGYKLK